MNHLPRRFWILAFVPLALVVIGTLGYRFIEDGWSWLDAVYMTVITLSTIGYGCLTDWVSIGSDGVHFGETVRCFATLVLTSVPMAIVLAVMLRYASLLRPGMKVTAGAARISRVMIMPALRTIVAKAAISTVGSFFG